MWLRAELSHKDILIFPTERELLGRERSKVGSKSREVTAPAPSSGASVWAHVGGSRTLHGSPVQLQIGRRLTLCTEPQVPVHASNVCTLALCHTASEKRQ